MDASTKGHRYIWIRGLTFCGECNHILGAKDKFKYCPKARFAADEQAVITSFGQVISL